MLLFARAFWLASRAAGREERASTSLIAVTLDFWGFCSSFSGAVAGRKGVVRSTSRNARTLVLDHAQSYSCFELASKSERVD